MSETTATVEGRILQTTIDCIEAYGISGATNRVIAQAAGVNIAAINYYFRSKDQLIQRVMEITLKNAFDLSDFPPMEGISAHERCTAIFLEILEGGIQYPNITRAHFHNLLVEGQPDPVLKAYVARFIEGQARDLQQRGLALPAGEVHLALLQIFSAIVMAILAPALYELPGTSLETPEGRRAYVARLVEKLLGTAR
jgi:TetR/AcrR family transcriptional regulator, regulator of cefoperazone and chloramphenicol sensitivity